MLSTIQIVSVLGSLLVLLAYVANQLGWLRATGLGYAFANIAGSGILAVIAALEGQWGFLLLEAVWASVSLVAVVECQARQAARTALVGGSKIVKFRRIFTRMRERRANLVHRDLSGPSDELWFELSKGLVWSPGPGQVGQEILQCSGVLPLTSRPALVAGRLIGTR
jgi:hypothetical protein